MKLALVAIPILLLSCRSEPEALEGISIRGRVFDDSNANGLLDGDESPMEGIVVYVDQNQNGLRDEDELLSTTDADGVYGFTDLALGTYRLHQELPFGWRNEIEAKPRMATTRGKGRAAIIGGSDVDAGLYSFMVSVGEAVGDDFFQFCGGALISDRFVLTAAHCSENTNPGDVAVMLGSQLANQGGTVVTVSAITIHPDWTGSTVRGYDMALWELSKRVDLAALGLSTVDMMRPQEELLASAGMLSTTIGWGVTDNPSDALQEVHVPITSDDRCAEAYPDVRTFETQICAGAVNGGLDSCQGDSGGPLLVRDPVGQRWLHAGITSWGDGCGLPGKPGIYGRTSAMSDWARTQIIEPSRFYDIVLGDQSRTFDFSNQPTTHSIIGATDDRWALSNIEMLSGDGQSVPANSSVGFRFFLFRDPSNPDSANYACQFDADGDGPLAPEEFSCLAGVNHISFGGYADGVFASRLEVQSASRMGHRTLFVRAGEPPFTETTGTLASSDGNDPDFAGDYYIDYFELADLIPGIVTRVEVESSFGLYLGLYDGNVRTASGGGFLDFRDGEGQDADMASFQFVPEAGRSYLVGVSTLLERRGGEYTVRMVNSGTAVATDL